MGPLALGTTPRDPTAARSTLKQRAAAASIGASSILAAVKLAAGFASGSLALLSEGAHNALDIGASGLTFFAVREADKPADADHPFGHAKFEAVAALAETGILAALAIVVSAAVCALTSGSDWPDGEIWAADVRFVFSASGEKFPAGHSLVRPNTDMSRIFRLPSSGMVRACSFRDAHRGPAAERQWKAKRAETEMPRSCGPRK